MARGFVQRTDRVLYWIIVLQVGAMTVAVNLQVFNRYVVNYVLGWEEEASRYLMIWSSFLAAAYALKSGEQLGVEFVMRLLPARVRRMVRISAHAATMIFLAVVAYQGFVWMLPQQLDQISPSIGFTMAIPYAAIPVSAVMLLWVEVLLVRQEFRGTEKARAEAQPLPL
ncbi:MAG: TRAP transporter small permease [candidate division NC10 bacterium]